MTSKENKQYEGSILTQEKAEEHYSEILNEALNQKDETSLNIVHIWIGDILLPNSEDPIPLFVCTDGTLMVTTQDASYITTEPQSLFEDPRSQNKISDPEIQLSKALQSKFSKSNVYRSSLDNRKNAVLVPINTLPAVCTTIKGMGRSIDFIIMAKYGLFAENIPPVHAMQCMGTASLIEVLATAFDIDPQTVSHYISKDDINQSKVMKQWSHHFNSIISEQYTINDIAEIAMRMFARH